MREYNNVFERVSRHDVFQEHCLKMKKNIRNGRIESELVLGGIRGGICPSRQCRRQCKIFASGVNFSIFTNFLCFFLTKTVQIR